MQDAQLQPQKLILGMQAAAYAFTVWRLYSCRLVKRQTGLVVFLLFRCLLMTSTTLVSQRSQLYFWTYVFFSPLDWLASIFAVREAIGLVLDDYPGLRTMGRWTMYGAVALALVLSLLIAALFWNPIGETNLYYVEVSYRSVVFGLAVVLVALLIFLSHYPLSLTRDRLVSTLSFGVLFLSEAVALFIDSMAARLHSPLVDLSAVAFGSVCLIVWGAILQPYEAPAKGIRQTTERNDRLLRQLRSMEEVVRNAGQSRA